MSSLLKGQILKPLLKFTKNLTLNQVKFSLLKGEGELPSLELDEVTVMRLIDLPTWLYLRRAHCSHVSLKVHWTKLRTHPIVVVIDRVDLDLEALNEPRAEDDQSIASYKTQSDRYKFTDKVIDGASVLINTVFIRFSAQAFNASIELSRLLLASKTPKWVDGPLNLTSLSFPNGDAVLIFKELSWESARIVADGLLAELNGIPVKLITNSGKIRLTLKKRISDSVLISSRVHLMLDDLLWVLTLSQLEAAIVFARSLRHIIILAAEQRRQFVAARAKRQTMSWRSVVANQTGPATSSRPGSYKFTNSSTNNQEQYSQAARIFHHYDVWETSYHVCVSRAEIHFCDEAKNECQLSQTVGPNGYVRLNLVCFELDWYPYHVDVSPQRRWKGCHEYFETRDAWLATLCHPQVKFTETVNLSTYDLSMLSPQQMSDRQADLPSPSSIQNVGVLRLHDFALSCVSFPSTCHEDPGKVKPTDQTSRIGLELPWKNNKNTFIGTDKQLHCLSDCTNILTLEVRAPYLKTSGGQWRSPEPSIMFGQINPCYLKFDGDTVIWLTAFLLTLQMNLSSLLDEERFSSPTASEDALVKLQESKVPRRPLLFHVRLEALMPRVILPLLEVPQSQLGSLSCSSLVIPDALVIQADQLIVQLLLPPLADSTKSALKQVILWCRSAPGVPTPTDGSPHPPLGLSALEQLVDSKQSGCQYETFDQASLQFWLIHCPNFWANFLTTVKRRTVTPSLRTSIQRQSLLEPIPLTIWATLYPCSDHLTQPMLSFIADLDSEYNPFSSNVDTIAEGCRDYPPKPIILKLGDFGNLSRTKWLQHRAGCNRILPDSVDQLIAVASLAYRLSQVKEQLTVDISRLILTNSSQMINDNWLYTLTALFTRPIHFCFPDEATFANLLNQHQDCLTDDPADCQLNRVSGSCEHGSGSPSESSFSCYAGSYSKSAPRNPQWRTDLTPSECILDRKAPNSSYLHTPFLDAGTVQRFSSPCNHPFYGYDSSPSLTGYRVSHSFSTRNSSFDTTSAADDNLDSVSVTTSSQGDWIKTYRCLFSLDSDNMDPDDTSVDEAAANKILNNHSGDLSPHTTEFVPLDEVGVEALDEIIDMQCEEHNHQKLVDDIQSFSSDVECGGQHETTTNTLERKPIDVPADFIIELLGVSVDADCTNREARWWINLCSLNIRTSSPKCTEISQNCEAVPSTPLWKLYASILLSDAVRLPWSSSFLWKTSISAMVSLSSEYRLVIPNQLITTLSTMTDWFLKRGGLQLLSSNLEDVGRTSQYPSPPPACVDAVLTLDGGSLQFEMGSEPPIQEDAVSCSALVRKIHLQQGLSIHLNQHAVLTLGHVTNAKQYDSSDVPNRLSVPQSSGCQCETAKLQQEVHRLTLELERLRSLQTGNHQCP